MYVCMYVYTYMYVMYVLASFELVYLVNDLPLTTNQPINQSSTLTPSSSLLSLIFFKATMVPVSVSRALYTSL